MDAQPAEPTVDAAQTTAQTAAAAFDAAVTSESTAPEPEVDHVSEAAKAARGANGRFAAPDVETTAKPDKKARHDPHARVEQAVAKQREAERRAEQAEQRASALEQERQRLHAPPPPRADAAPAATPSTEKFPRFDQWSATHPEATHDDYLDARDEWRDARTETVQRARQDTAQRTHAFETRAQTFGQRYAEAVQADATLSQRINPQLLTAKPLSTLTTEDKAIISAIPDPTQRNQFAFLCFLADQWIDSDHAVALLEYVSDPREFQRLATLPPDQVIRQLARVEAGFAAAPSDRGPVAKPPAASQAHPPIKPLGSAPRSPDADDGSDDEPFEKFLTRENAKDRKAGRLG
jgi:hypothetical protein